MSLKSMLKKVVNDAGFDVVRKANSERRCEFEREVYSERGTLYERAILSCLKGYADLNVVVVGANDGKINDPFYRILGKNNELVQRTKVLLVEPQASLVPFIKENYRFHPDARVENCAIGRSGELTLFSVKETYWPMAQPPYATNWPVYRAPTGITSSNREHVAAWALKHIAGLTSAEDAVVETIVPARPLIEALKRASMPDRVHILQVDAEGNDDMVIYASELQVTQPAVIFFEDKEGTSVRRDKLSEYLRGHGYIELSAGADTIALRIS